MVATIGTGSFWRFTARTWPPVDLRCHAFSARRATKAAGDAEAEALGLNATLDRGSG